MDTEIFKSLPTRKLFFRCVIPSIMTMTFGALYQIMDGVFVGRFIGEDALAAVNLVMPIIMIIFSFSDMVAIGASVRISILLGERKREEASQIFSFTIKIILLLSFLIGFLGLFFAEHIVNFISPNATEQAKEYAIIYVKTYAIFSPLLPVYFATDNFLRVCGKEKLSMWINIGTQLINVILDMVLIAFLGMGVFAAAFTSCFAISIGTIITLALFYKKSLDLYYTKKNISFKVFFNIIINGSSEFFNSISTSIMSIIYNFFLLKYGGTTAVAAFSVIMYVDSIVNIIILGICEALQPSISYCYGAGMFKKVKLIFKYIIISAICISIIAMFSIIFASNHIVSFFVNPKDTDLLAISISGIELFAISYLTGWVDICFSSYFTAVEKPIYSLLIAFWGTVIIPIVFLVLFTPIWHLNGIWITIITASIVSAILTIIFVLIIKIKTKKNIIF